MKTLTMYCGARDQNVQVVLTDAPSHDGHATLLDADVVCLDLGEKCTGSLCPVCAEPTTAMAVKLIRRGLPVACCRTVQMTCSACDRDTEHVALSTGDYVCGECASIEPRGPTTTENDALIAER